ncbi:tetratricopeptide repeat protein [Winogradskyella bathintestinalis]|uniref:Tetratricopeptide repeat protein n=1 Tax=Winogradskyella bathintestinalis TaxID=3035208 RepID=A0ABT7ZTR3_9FLAO|nr:tetratricopeptide repeat protein [Winogradskyella bathintestinalis]MDN3492393.1 tetratricopeptide repeat protein [Winogradskyella bathintestinalis]
MKLKILLFTCTIFFIFNCSNNIDYSEAFIKETSGIYLYNPDDIIEVTYENNTLFLNWRGGKIKPVALDQNEFFVPDMYQKFRFVQHSETKKWYLSIIPEDDEGAITYDYQKVPSDYKTPSTHFKEGHYEKALEGYLKIKEQDSTSSFINEWDFNNMGYEHLGNHDYEKAIEILKINATLHPNSANVYDSLAEAYLHNGDSMEAYIHYKKTLEISPKNKSAQQFVTKNKIKYEN